MNQPNAPQGENRTVANMELVGGRSAVDFVNTVSDRGMERPWDRIRSYADLLAWCRRVEIIGADETRRLADSAAARPAEADLAVERARELREALYRLFVAEVEHTPAPEDALATLNASLGEAMANRLLQPTDDGLRWSWAGHPDRLDRILWPLAWEAAELLASSEVGRLKTCAQDACRWVFLDLSRNRSRRWCTMEDCGNRAKARRHYHRHRGAG